MPFFHETSLVAMLKRRKNRSCVGTEIPIGSGVPLKTFLDLQVGELRRKLSLSLGKADDEEDNG